ncbi:GNAT family N-acetyltransferase [Streptomyces sp. NPDC087425]|uniref:GNAT family N-acetyltransferase n=1 Tax=Streptomyces sp. NPDC087425 TaxID=3365787 RepID=UPI00380DE319
MTDVVVRALDASTAPLFDTLPDPLDDRTAHRLTRHRPDWKRVALRDGVVVARGAWWGGPDDVEPVTVNWFDVAEGQEAAGAVLLRTAPWQVELELNVPAGWPDDPRVRAAAEARVTAARATGYEPLAERLLYRWTPACGVPERPGRLVFRAEPDDAVFLDALRRIHSATLDAHALGAVAEGGLDGAVQQDFDFFGWCPSPRAWWQVAHPRQGDPVGTHIPARNPTGPCAAFIGVLPEHRGHGHASTRGHLNFRPHPPN